VSGRRTAWTGWLLTFAAGCAGAGSDRAPAVGPPPADTVAVGAGRYSTILPPNEKPPANHAGLPVKPKVTAAFSEAGLLPNTNDWWSSLIWQFDRGGKSNPFSEPLFAHPLALKALPEGLGLGGAGPPQIAPRAFSFPYLQDLRAGVEGLAATSTRVDRYDDWTVTASWELPGATLKATFGHGLPFVYFEATGPAATITLDDSAEVRVFAETPGSLGVTVAGRAYGLFAPTGAVWTRKGDRLFRSDLRGRAARGVFSVALLPEATAATLARFRRHAFAFVTSTRVSWQYDAAAAALHTTFTLDTTAREPGGDGAPLVALYPHQWKNLGRDLGAPSYPSPRGPMKLLSGRSFSTRLPFGGILPILPRPPEGAFEASRLASMVRASARGDLFPAGLEGTRGSYWMGKSLLRVSLLAWLADQIGLTETRAQLVGSLQRVLEDWFDGRSPNLFHYDRTWATLIGLPAEYRSGWELNDHHFHYGQFIFAAATVARFDPAWAQDDRWGGFVDLLIRDCANPRRDDRRFPFLRNFDPYAGHSWANGPAQFAEGNNQESSSEDVNFANAVLLWGAFTGKTELRDLGIFLHANLVSAIEQYWFDVDGDTFPAGFTRPTVAMVWGNGGRYDTWWDRNPIYVHGINFLPFTGGSLYLGRHPEYVRRNYQTLVEANKGEPRIWRDIIWMFQALGDPHKALAIASQNPHFDPEFGASRAFVYQWLHALARYGQVDTTVTADTATYAVLRDGGTRHHVAFNPTLRPTQVRFSDGVSVALQPYEQKVVSSPVTTAADRKMASRPPALPRPTPAALDP
jgi:endoglucanase Acf2